MNDEIVRCQWRSGTTVFALHFFVCLLLQGCFPVKQNDFVGYKNPVGVWKCYSSSCMVNDVWADFFHSDSVKSQPNVSCTEIYNADMDLRVSIL